MPELRAGRARICSASLLLAAAFSSPQPLLAACSENFPADGATVSCSGTDPVGIRGTSARGVSVLIHSGASIDTADVPAIELGAGAFIENRGTLDSGGGYTLRLSDGDDELVNSGSIAGSVHLGDGDNRVALNGGHIERVLLGGRHGDTLVWNGGSVGDSILLGAGDDSANLNGGATPADTMLNGGFGHDRLLLSNQSLQGAGLYGWEHIRLSDDSAITINAPLSLGDSDALPSRLTIDAGSRLLIPEFTTSITAVAGGALAIENHGSIDLRGETENELRIAGDYTGTGGLYLDAIVGGDDSQADRLLIDGGHASGSTRVHINKLGGRGGRTDTGILVIEAINGGSTGAGAFHMPEPISAGPYEYYLFRGGESADEADNWYLRNNLLPGSAPPSIQPTTPAIYARGGVPADAGNEIHRGPPVPLYRPEVPLYAQIKSLAQQTSLQQISSFQQRRGEQRNWSSGQASGGLRLYHRDTRLAWDGDVHSAFDGRMSGLQLNGNLYAGPSCRGAQELGLFAGSSFVRGDVSGFARGSEHYRAGENQLDSYYFGAYFSDYRRDNSYLDILVKLGYVMAESRSYRGLSSDTRGPQLTLSAERGFALPLGEHFNLEPQLQAVINYTNLSAYRDGISTVEPDMTPEVSFRAGLRAYNTRGDNQYYLFGSLWHTLDGNDELRFDGGTWLENRRGATWLEAGAGLVLLDTGPGNLFFNLSYQQSADDLDWRGGSANLGFDLNW